MADIATNRITLDVHSPISQANINVRRNDTNRQLIVSLADGSEPFTIPQNAQAVFAARKADGTMLFNPCEISGNEITYKFTQQTTAVPGFVKCELRVYSAEKQLLTSPRFCLSVYNTVYRDGDVPSGPQFDEIDNLIFKLTELIGVVQNIGGGTVYDCVTPADTAEKTIDIGEETISPGKRVYVRFKNGSTVETATLSAGGSTYPIYKNPAAGGMGTTGNILADFVAELIAGDTFYLMINVPNEDSLYIVEYGKGTFQEIRNALAERKTVIMRKGAALYQINAEAQGYYDFSRVAYPLAAGSPVIGTLVAYARITEDNTWSQLNEYVAYRDAEDLTDSDFYIPSSKLMIAKLKEKQAAFVGTARQVAVFDENGELVPRLLTMADLGGGLYVSSSAADAPVRTLINTKSQEELDSVLRGDMITFANPAALPAFGVSFPVLFTKGNKSKSFKVKFFDDPDQTEYPVTTSSGRSLPSFDVPAGAVGVQILCTFANGAVQMVNPPMIGGGTYYGYYGSTKFTDLYKAINADDQAVFIDYHGNLHRLVNKSTTWFEFAYVSSRNAPAGSYLVSVIRVDNNDKWTTEYRGIFAQMSGATPGQIPVVEKVNADGVPTAWRAEDIPSGGDIGLGVTGATVGQIIEVESVDESGHPTKWLAVDKPSGGGSDVVVEYNVTPWAEVLSAYKSGAHIVCLDKTTFAPGIIRAELQYIAVKGTEPKAFRFASTTVPSNSVEAHGYAISESGGWGTTSSNISRTVKVEYNVTPFDDVLAAYQSGATVVCYDKAARGYARLAFDYGKSTGTTGVCFRNDQITSTTPKGVAFMQYVVTASGWTRDSITLSNEGSSGGNVVYVEYGVTTFPDVLALYESGAYIVCVNRTQNPASDIYAPLSWPTEQSGGIKAFTFCVVSPSGDSMYGIKMILHNVNGWTFRDVTVGNGGVKQVYTATITSEVGRLVCDMTAPEIIDADRVGIVKAVYTDPETSELRTYYYAKQASDRRAVFSKDGYIVDGVPNQTLIFVDNSGNVTTETRSAGPDTSYAVCHDPAASPSSTANNWYIPKTMPRPSGNVGMMVDVYWEHGRVNGLGYNASLIWGAPDGPDNEVIVSGASITDTLTGEHSIPTEGTVRYQLEESNGRKRWQYVSGNLIPTEFSTATAAATADKLVHGLSLGYLPGMEIYVQMDAGNSADLMRLVPDEGETLPVYGNGTGAHTGDIPAGYILHLKNAGDHWQVINSPGKDGGSGGPLEPLTFTGAVSETYDGTKPVTVDIKTAYPISVESASTLEITPNVYHKWPEMATLSITLGTETPGVVNEFCGEFVSGSSPTNFSVPGDIKWVNELKIEANKTYQFSIINGIGVIAGA